MCAASEPRVAAPALAHCGGGRVFPEHSTTSRRPHFRWPFRSVVIRCFGGCGVVSGKSLQQAAANVKKQQQAAGV